MSETDLIPTAPPPRRPHGALVRLGVAATALIFLACAALVLYRGLTVEVPDGVLITRASPAWEGAVASVDGVNLARPQTGAFAKASKYTIAFHLIPGDYTFTVNRRDQTLFSDKFSLTRQQKSGRLYLPDVPDTLAPTTRPASPFESNFRWGED